MGGNNGIRGQKIIFDNQVLNVGNGFKWYNQSFHAPYPGSYFFSISGTKNGVYNDSRACVAVLVNGASIDGEAVSSESTLFGGFAYQFARKLNASDKLELVMKFGKFYSIYFTGWMLDEDLLLI